MSGKIPRDPLIRHTLAPTFSVTVFRNFRGRCLDGSLLHLGSRLGREFGISSAKTITDSQPLSPTRDGSHSPGNIMQLQFCELMRGGGASLSMSRPNRGLGPFLPFLESTPPIRQLNDKRFHRLGLRRWWCCCGNIRGRGYVRFLPPLWGHLRCDFDLAIGEQVGSKTQLPDKLTDIRRRNVAICY